MVRKAALSGKGTLIGVRLHLPHLTKLDSWIAWQKEPLTRPEAIRRLLELSLEQAAKNLEHNNVSSSYFPED
jgi:hypothetical protein